MLARRSGDLPLRLRVVDDAGALIYGSADVDTTISSRLAFPMLFYPAEEIQARMSGGAANKTWQIEVGAPAIASAVAGMSQSYWPTLLSVALMLVALGLTVQAHRRSAELAEMQTDFVAHVSHQLKTPLSLLSAATETLQLDRIRSPEKLGEYLDTIRAEAARLSTLVQRVLEFSRVQQDRNYEFEHVDFGALTRETVDAFAHGLAGHQFTFDVDIDGPGPYVHVDPAAIEQALANLLDNAVKYPAPSRRLPCACAAIATWRSSKSPIGASAWRWPISPASSIGSIARRAATSPGVRVGPADCARSGAGPRRPRRDDQRPRRRQHVSHHPAARPRARARRIESRRVSETAS